MLKLNRNSNEFDDHKTSIQDLKNLVDDFVSERLWEKFHSPKNIAISVAIEAAELLEHFQWSPPASEEISERKKIEISEELSDVLAYLLSLANKLNIDVSSSMFEKMKKNRLKYPASDFQGNYEKKTDNK